MDELKEKVLAEIEEARVETGSQWDTIPAKVRGECIYFNNFNMSLPYGVRRRHAEEMGFLDDPEHSVSGKTLGKFYRDIDDAIKEEAIDRSQIERLQQKGVKSIEARGELFRLMIPVFIRLRKQGYSHGDLIS